jgi:Uma2 family endonuclease
VVRFYRTYLLTLEVSIPEFKEYVLIDQYQYYVMHYVKTADGKWVLDKIEGESGTLSLETVDFQIMLSDL